MTTAKPLRNKCLGCCKTRQEESDFVWMVLDRRIRLKSRRGGGISFKKQRRQFCKEVER